MATSTLRRQQGRDHQDQRRELRQELRHSRAALLPGVNANFTSTILKKLASFENKKKIFSFVKGSSFYELPI